MPFLLSFAAIAYIGSMLVGNTGILMEPGLENADTVLPVMLFKHAPFALASLIIAGGAAAAMSTTKLSNSLRCLPYGQSIFTSKYINKNISQHALVWVGRWAILIFAIAYLMSVFTFLDCL